MSILIGLILLATLRAGILLFTGTAIFVVPLALGLAMVVVVVASSLLDLKLTKRRHNGSHSGTWIQIGIAHESGG